jgi:hypothetical protein
MDLDFMKSFNMLLYEEEEQEEDIPPPEMIDHDQVRDAEALHNKQEPNYKDRPRLNQIFFMPKSTKTTKTTKSTIKANKKKVKVNRT